MSSKWDYRFLDQAELVAGWSKDPSTKVGAVIVDGAYRVVSQGFNGFARSVKDTQKRLQDRTVKYRMVLHAECNAILFARRDLHNCTIYTWPLPPCAQCASMIIQAGITRVVSLAPTAAQMGRWGDDLEIAGKMFREAGVQMLLPLRPHDLDKRTLQTP